MFEFAGTGGGTVDWSTGLRPYQVEDDEAVWAALTRTGFNSAALVLPTGTGKTRTAAGFVRRWLQRSPLSRVLWLANRDFLVKGAAAVLREMCGVSLSIEKAEKRMSSTRIVVGSVQTLKGARLRSIPDSAFDLIIYDECHHAVSAGSMVILEHFKAKRLGLTATLNRHDKVGAWNAWETIAAERSLQWAWTEGYLVRPIPIAEVIDEVNLSDVNTVAGDLNKGQLETEMAKVAAPIAQLWRKHLGTKQSIGYTPGVASAHAVAATWNDWEPGSTVAVDADTPDEERDRVLARFDSGDLLRIVNCGIYLEGLDVPKCQGIVIARPTKSESLYIQMAGRGGRPEGWIGQLPSRDERRDAIAASGKPNFILLDITGHAGRHNLCSAATLAGKETPAKELAEAIVATPGIDLESAAKQARAAVAREQERIAEMACSAEVKARQSTFDVLGGYGVSAEGIQLGEPGESPTGDDLQWLGANKLPTAGLSRADVQKLQRTAAVWRRHGFATFKQRRTLGTVGIPTPHNLSFATASTLIQHVIDTRFRPNREYVAGFFKGRDVGAEG
jgi:superfamily II DNA or RNA helicase